MSNLPTLCSDEIIQALQERSRNKQKLSAELISLACVPGNGVVSMLSGMDRVLSNPDTVPLLISRIKELGHQFKKVVPTELQRLLKLLADADLLIKRDIIASANGIAEMRKYGENKFTAGPLFKLNNKR